MQDFLDDLDSPSESEYLIDGCVTMAEYEASEAKKKAPTEKVLPKPIQIKNVGIARWPQSTEPSPDEKFRSDLKAIKEKIETE